MELRGCKGKVEATCGLAERHIDCCSEPHKREGIEQAKDDSDCDVSVPSH